MTSKRPAEVVAPPNRAVHGEPPKLGFELTKSAALNG